MTAFQPHTRLLTTPGVGDVLPLHIGLDAFELVRTVCAPSVFDDVDDVCSHATDAVKQDDPRILRDDKLLTQLSRGSPDSRKRANDITKMDGSVRWGT